MDLFQRIIDYITQALGPQGPLIVVGVVGVLMVLLALPLAMRRPSDPFDRLQGANTLDSKSDLANGPNLRQQRSGPNLDRFAAYLEPQDQKEYSKSQLKLVQAGYRSKGAVRTFHFLQMMLGIGGLIGGALYMFFSAQETDLMMLAAKVLGPGAAGYYLPTYWVERRRQARMKEMLEAFPDALDLMLICVESGQTLDHTILRVSRELEKSYPTLSEELTIISNETRAGKDRSTVLKDFGDRCEVPDIKAFVTVMIQSAQFGTTIGEALRLFSSEMRDKRVMRAEEKANTLPTKMTLCTMLFTLPPLLVILVGPSMYDIIRFIGGAGNGG